MHINKSNLKSQKNAFNALKCLFIDSIKFEYVYNRKIRQFEKL